MSWLDRVVGDMLKKLPKDAFGDATFGFGDIRAVVALGEQAIQQYGAISMDTARKRAVAAAADPSYNFVENPVFAPMAAEFWKAEMTFPRVLRNSLLIASYSHLEHHLLSLCVSTSADPQAPKRLRKKPKDETTPHWYLRYLRDEVAIDLGDFTQWQEWEAIDAYRLARNCLAHNGGIVDDDNHAGKIAALPHVQVDDSGLIATERVVHLLPGACAAATDIAQTFLSRAVAAAEKDPRWRLEA